MAAGPSPGSAAPRPSGCSLALDALLRAAGSRGGAGLLATCWRGCRASPPPSPASPSRSPAAWATPPGGAHLPPPACLLALGRASGTTDALRPSPRPVYLAASAAPAGIGPTLPPCSPAADLIPRLLERPGEPRVWGFHLAARYTRARRRPRRSSPPSPTPPVPLPPRGSSARGSTCRAACPPHPRLNPLRHPEVGRQLLALHSGHAKGEKRPGAGPPRHGPRSRSPSPRWRGRSTRSSGWCSAPPGPLRTEVADGILALAPDDRRGRSPASRRPGAMRLLPGELGAAEPTATPTWRPRWRPRPGLASSPDTPRPAGPKPTPARYGPGELRDRRAWPLLRPFWTSPPAVASSTAGPRKPGRIGGPEARWRLAAAARSRTGRRGAPRLPRPGALRHRGRQPALPRGRDHPDWLRAVGLRRRADPVSRGPKTWRRSPSWPAIRCRPWRTALWLRWRDDGGLDALTPRPTS